MTMKKSILVPVVIIILAGVIGFGIHVNNAKKQAVKDKIRAEKIQTALAGLKSIDDTVVADLKKNGIEKNGVDYVQDLTYKRISINSIVFTFHYVPDVINLPAFRVEADLKPWMVSLTRLYKDHTIILRGVAGEIVLVELSYSPLDGTITRKK